MQDLLNKMYDKNNNTHTLFIKNNRLSSNGSLTEPRRKILFFPICHSVDGRPSDCIKILWRKSKGNYLSVNRYVFLSSFPTGLVEHKQTVGNFPLPITFGRFKSRWADYAHKMGSSLLDSKIFHRAVM